MLTIKTFSKSVKISWKFAFRSVKIIWIQDTTQDKAVINNELEENTIQVTTQVKSLILYLTE